MKQVTITVLPDGTSTMDAEGFKGKGCTEATEMIAIALGGNDSSNRDERRKPDFYAQVPGTNTLRGG